MRALEYYRIRLHNSPAKYPVVTAIVYSYSLIFELLVQGWSGRPRTLVPVHG